MRRFKHIWERRENRRSSASAAHLERLGLREHEPFLLGERGDRLLFLGRGRLLLLGGHRAAEGGPRAPEWGVRRIARAETSATQNELTRFARDAQLVRMREQSRDSGERAYRENCANSGVSVWHSGAHPARRSATRERRESPRTASNPHTVAAHTVATMSDSDAPEYDDGASPDPDRDAHRPTQSVTVTDLQA